MNMTRFERSKVDLAHVCADPDMPQVDWSHGRDSDDLLDVVWREVDEQGRRARLFDAHRPLPPRAVNDAGVNVLAFKRHQYVSRRKAMDHTGRYHQRGRIIVLVHVGRLDTILSSYESIFDILLFVLFSTVPW
jgi:hypothetical protein